MEKLVIFKEYRQNNFSIQNFNRKIIKDGWLKIGTTFKLWSYFGSKTNCTIIANFNKKIAKILYG